jgi:hypothetical protein
MVFFTPLPLGAEEKLDVVEHESGFYYTVKPGDTLWGLSQKFADSPYQWPDLWKDNKQIANPHRIFPGDRILLYRKSGVEAAKVKEPPPPAVEAPPPEPPKPPPSINYDAINQVGFIRRAPIPFSGTLIKVKEDKTAISTGDLIYIRPAPKSEFAPGARYTVYRNLKPLKMDQSRTVVGYQHYLTGVVEVTDIQAKYIIAQVISSYKTIEIDDKVIPYEPRASNILLTPGNPDLYGTIVETQENTNMFGQNDIGFIDKGGLHGVQVGQQYSIFYQPEKKIRPLDYKREILAPLLIGEFVVVRVEPHFSSVLVTLSDKSIVVGTPFCQLIR